MILAALFEGVFELIQAHAEPLAFLILILCGIGLPVPEEPILLGAGYVLVERVAAGAPAEVLLLKMTLVCASGALLGDLMTFTLGRRVGRRIFSIGFVSKIATRPRRVRAERFFQRYGAWAVFLTGFLAGVRLVTYFSAGMSRRVSYPKFILMDSLRLLISVPISIYIGYVVGKEFHDFAKAKKELSLFHGILIAAIALGLLTWWIIARMRRKPGRHGASRAGPPAGAAGPAGDIE